MNVAFNILANMVVGKNNKIQIIFMKDYGHVVSTRFKLGLR